MNACLCSGSARPRSFSASVQDAICRRPQSGLPAGEPPGGHHHSGQSSSSQPADPFKTGGQKYGVELSQNKFSQGEIRLAMVPGDKAEDAFRQSTIMSKAHLGSSAPTDSPLP
jgi:hypothetical protein